MNTIFAVNAPKRALFNPAMARRWKKIPGTAFCLGLASFFLLCDAQAETRYRVTALAGPGSDFTVGVALNNSGEVVGDYRTESSGHGFIYRGGAMHDLLGGRADNYIQAINNSGRFVGYFYDAENRLTSYMQGSTGQFTILGLYCYPTAINDSNVIVGDYGGNRGAFIYQNGQMTKLPTVQGYPLHATHINNRGQILASYVTDNAHLATSRLVLISCGQIQEIGTPSGSETEDVFGIDLNDQGVILCSGNTSVSGAPWYFYKDGRWQLVHRDSEYSTFTAFTAINNRNQMVGYRRIMTATSNTTYPLLRSCGHEVNLNTLIDPKAGATLWQPMDINDLGQILVFGEDLYGTRMSFLLTPYKIGCKHENYVDRLPEGRDVD